MTPLGETKLGPYEIFGPLGARGMGEPYRARHTRLGRDVAINVPPGSTARVYAGAFRVGRRGDKGTAPALGI